MGLSTLIQIPCHHVVANQNSLKFKKGPPLKQFFNINLGIGIIKKLLFCSYFQHISLCFYSNFDRESSLDVELDSASNEYSHSILLMDPATPKTRNTWKNVAGSIKSMPSEYSLDAKFNSASNELSRSKFE